MRRSQRLCQGSGGDVGGASLRGRLGLGGHFHTSQAWPHPSTAQRSASSRSQPRTFRTVPVNSRSDHDSSCCSVRSLTCWCSSSPIPHFLPSHPLPVTWSGSVFPAGGGSISWRSGPERPEPLGIAVWTRTPLEPLSSRDRTQRRRLWTRGCSPARVYAPTRVNADDGGVGCPPGVVGVETAQEPACCCLPYNWVGSLRGKSADTALNKPFNTRT